MKPIRLQVEMPTIGMFSIKGRTSVGGVEEPIETTVDALRRAKFKGIVAEDHVWARAFVPERFRLHLSSGRRLIDGEYVWCVARLADNKKSLAPFLASGDDEWKVEVQV